MNHARGEGGRDEACGGPQCKTKAGLPRWALVVCSAGVFVLAMYCRVAQRDTGEYGWRSPPHRDGYHYDMTAVNLIRDHRFEGVWYPDIVAAYPDTPKYKNVHVRAGKRSQGGARPPGYPIFLAIVYSIFGRNFLAAHIIQAVMSALTCVVLFWVGRRLFGFWVGLLASVFLALDHCQTHIAGRFFTETLVHFLFCVAMLFMAHETHTKKARFAFLAGLLMGLATQTRWNFLLASMAIGAWFLARAWKERWGRREILATVWYGVGMALVMIPWTVRQSVNYGHFCLLSETAGTGFADGNSTQNFEAPARQRGGWILINLVGSVRERNAQGWRVGFEGIRTHWSEVPYHLMCKLRQFYHPRRVFPFRIPRIRYPLRWMFFPFVFGGLVLLIRPGHRWIPLAFLAQNASVLIFFAMDRFRWPFHGMMFLCAAFGLVWLVRVSKAHLTIGNCQETAATALTKLCSWANSLGGWLTRLGSRVNGLTTRLPRASGFLLIALSLLANPRLLGWLFSPDGAISMPRNVAVIALFELFCAGLGLALAFRPLICRRWASSLLTVIGRWLLRDR